jgi:hypothetical protein
VSLEDSIAKLRDVGSDARGLFDVLKDLADQGRKARQTEKDKITRLVKKLDTTTRTAARERRAAEIEKLTELIDAGETVLSITGLSSSTRNAVKADLTRRRARRTRLRNLDATDFGGILKADEVRQLEDLVKAARKEVEQKKLAAAFLGSVFKIGDLALTMAGKLAI